jgi:hypothetical protein
MKALKYILSLATTIAGLNSYATILTVKQDGSGDYTQIQEAINASSDGDTVLAWPGRYYENLDFSGKNITLASRMLTTGDPSYKYNTIIDGNYSGSCVNIMSGEIDAVLYGLSLQHGSGEIWAYPTQGVGGGINVAYSSCSIQYCDISYNLTTGAGGGISIIYSEGNQLIGTSIHHNRTYGSGGGIAIGNGGEVHFDSLNRCNLFNNYASRGCDLHKVFDDILYVHLDTGTVLYPDSYFFSCIQEEGYQVNGIVYSIWNAKITPKDADLYVNPLTGDNSNSGLTPIDPLKSIAYAYSSIVVDSLDRNTIHLANGTYSDSTNNEKFPLNIRPFINVIGQSRDMTILDGMYKCSIIIGNKEVSNYSYKKMSMWRGGCIISNQLWAPAGFAYLRAENANVLLDSILFTEGLGYSGFGQLGLNGTGDVLVSNCEFYDNIGAHAVRVGVQGDTVRFRNCIFRDNKPDSTQQFAWGGAMTLISFETDIYIENCLFTRNNNYNVGASASFYDQGNHYFINCTFSGNTKLSPNRSLGSVDANSFIYNSVFFDEGHPKPIALAWDEAIDTINLEIYHSLIENGESGVYIEPGGPTRFYYDESNIQGNPVFDTASSYPFSLGDGSPCIDAGTPLWYAGADYPYITQEDSMLLLHINENKAIELSNVDLAGNPRVWNNAIDMGAYEYGPWVKVDEFEDTPTDAHQLFVYPNPFSSNAQIGYRTIKAGRVEINVYDTYGRNVACLLDSRQPEGKGVFTWTTSNSGTNIIKPGTYLICLKINGETVETSKVIIL